MNATIARFHSCNNYHHSLSSTMLTNYFKVALRNIFRNKLFSTLNIVGLALAMSVGLLIIAILVDQSSVDHFHLQKDRIFRITSKSQYMAFDSYRMATTATPLVAKMKSDYPEYVESFVNIRRSFAGDVASSQKTIPLSGHLVSPSFFEVFSFPMIEGGAEGLKNPNNIILTESAVQKLLPDQSPIGEIVTVAPYGDFIVIGIVADPPRQSHMQFEMLGSFATISALEETEILYPTLENWLSYSANYIYLTLPKDISTDQMHAALNQISDEIYGENEQLDVRFALQPLLSISPGWDYSNQIGPVVSTEMILGLGFMALIVIASAGFNYTNLTIARSLKRGKEIGIRKVLGGNRNQLIKQFIVESIFVSFIAVLLSTGIYIFLKEAFLSIASAEMASILSLETNGKVILSFLAFAVLVGVFAGFVPSLFLSKMKPSSILKGGGIISVFRFVSLRKSLVVVQFALSLIFIMLATVAYQQYKFFMNFDNGYRSEGIINVPLKGNQGDVMMNEFRRLSEIEDGALSSIILSTGTSNNTWAGLPTKDSMLVNQFWTDHQFLEVMEIPLVAGKPFTMGLGSDKVLINETMSKELGFVSPDEAIGMEVSSLGINWIIHGVTKDYQYHRALEPMGSVMIKNDPSKARYLSLRYNTPNPGLLIDRMEAVWNKVDNHVHPYEASLFSDQLDSSYVMFTNTTKIIGMLAALAISIATLGLLGMAVYTVETRIKEVGIRKVLGASEKKLVYLLSGGFIRLLLISSVVAFVLVWLLLHQVLLPNLANSASPGILEYASGIVMMLTLGSIIIGSQTWKAAKSNPATTLSEE